MEFFINFLFGNQDVVAIVSAAFLSTLLALHYLIFGKSFSNKNQYFNVIPIIAVTTCAIILVIKSSLALSLGLIGALSIVRFRTPVKEPEELAYLFIAILIGISQGALMFEIGYFAMPILLILLVFLRKFSSNKYKGEKYIYSISIDSFSEGVSIDKLAEIIKSEFDNSEIQRLLSSNGALEIIVSTDKFLPKGVDLLEREIKNRFNGQLSISVSLAADPLL